MPARFQLGKVLITPGALDTLDTNSIQTSLNRHLNGDWGDVCSEDHAANEHALQHDLRLLSVYHDSRQTKFWILTEADRSSTTILLPSEY